jgi:signal transduction histidine kinase/ActR/RegA family two-component response regulator
MSSSASVARPDGGSGNHQILRAQIHLLYANAGLAVLVSILGSSILARLQSGIVSSSVVIGWWLYMVLVSVSRYVLAHRFRRASPQGPLINRWGAAYALFAGLVGAGWGAGGFLLYPEADPMNQIFLIFIIGGMMLGASTVLAPRPEAFLAFLIPAGLLPALRLFLHGDATHLAMGTLAAVFTVAVVITTWRIYCTVLSSLRLQFENRHLVEDLQAAKDQTEALNQALELRVEERTAELRRSTDQLRAEIARREQMEEELLRVRNLESLGVLAGGIAHDFNNFLTVVQGNIELAKARLKADEPTREILDETTSACRRAALLSSQLLTFAKGGAPVRRVVSMDNVVMDAVHLVRAGATVSVAVTIANDLRPAKVDPGQIVQVLHNILLNARQSMPEGGIIEVTAENVCPDSAGYGSRVRVSIRDYGCGIPAEVLPRIFDPYFTTKPGATGLGLATAYAIVAKHGGHISVESKPGNGTVFLVELPAAHEAPAPEAPVAAHTHTGNEHVLVMDDEEGVRKLLKSVLTRLGYEVETAGDGAEAVALYEQARVAGNAFDIVLLDLTVRGGMGGIEAAAKLKELDPAAKLIVSSGYSDAPVMSNFADYGFDGVLPKPWTAAELSELLRRVLVAHPESPAD